MCRLVELNFHFDEPYIGDYFSLRLEEQFRVGIYDKKIVGTRFLPGLGAPLLKKRGQTHGGNEKIWFNCDDVWINPSGMENIFFFFRGGNQTEKE